MQTTHPLCNLSNSAGLHAWRSRAVYAQLGFQLLEILLVTAIISILAIVAIPSYAKYREKVDIAQAKGDVASISLAIEQFYADNHGYPDSLDDVRMGTLQDPWGNPYQYLKIYGADIKGKGQFRKDKNLVPVNTDYDLYSMGKDGSSKPPFTAKPSQDDIVRANNGKFVGLVADY
jgi:general secretion pathway protein G